MKNLVAGLILIFALMAAGNVQASNVLTFDDIEVPPDVPYIGYITNPYGGLLWTQGESGWNVLSPSNYSLYGNTYATSNFVFNGTDGGVAGSPLIITRSGGGLFDFYGADYSTFAFNDGFLDPYSSETITVKGYRDGVETGSIEYVLSSDAFVRGDANCGFLGIDTLKFFNDGGTEATWTMDNFEYAPSAVPEPSSLILLGTGIGGFASVALRRKRKTA
jgi:hypothetical protein